MLRAGSALWRGAMEAARGVPALGRTALGAATLGAALLAAALGAAAIAAPATLAAQEGTITYTHSVKLDIELPPALAELKAEMPSALTSTMILHFNSSGSLMTESREAPAQQDGAARKTVAVAGRGVVSEMPLDVSVAVMSEMMAGMKMMVSTMGAAGMGTADPSALLSAYESYEDGTLIEAREFLGRTFRVSEARPPYNWQMTTEQAMHLGYPVMKATTEHDSTVVEAWFTPAIPVEGGPAAYGGLPGMILLLSLDGGKTQYQATDVSLQELEEGMIRPPDEGREVSREEFERIVAEKMEEIMKTSGIRRIGRD